MELSFSGVCIPNKNISCWFVCFGVVVAILVVLLWYGSCSVVSVVVIRRL